MVSPFQSHHNFLDNFAKEMEEDLIRLKQESKEFWKDYYAEKGESEDKNGK